MGIRNCIRRCKRTILMASLFLKLSDKSSSGTAALAVCNAELKLVDDVNSLQLPESLKNLLWSKVPRGEVEQYLEKGDVESACKEIWDNTPSLIKYGEDTFRDMQLTIRHVLRVRLNHN